MYDIKYAVETLDECLEEMKPILEDHYKEVAMYQDKIPLDPDYDKYYSIEDLGMLHIVTVRDRGKLVGYFISVISPNMHYNSTLFAVNDILYINPEYRDKGVGQRMFAYVEKELYSMGVKVITIHMKTALPFDSLCSGMGYDYAERNYAKYIGD